MLISEYNVYKVFEKLCLRTGLWLTACLNQEFGGMQSTKILCNGLLLVEELFIVGVKNNRRK